MDQLSPSEFIQIVQTGTTAQVKELLEKDPGLGSSKNEQGISALILAIYNGKTDTARLLADQRSDLTIWEAAALDDLDRVEALLEEDSPRLTALHRMASSRWVWLYFSGIPRWPHT